MSLNVRRLVEARVTKKRVSILKGLATEIVALSGTASRRSAVSWNLAEEIKSLASRDYGWALRKSLGRPEVLEIIAEARNMVWPHLNFEAVRLVTPREFTRLWSSLGVDFRLANFGGQRGLALMGFYAGNLGPSRRPLIYVNTAHHPAAVGAAFTHEMGHHLTARIFDSQKKEPAHYLAYTAYADHLADPPELAADCLVSLGIFPADIARKMFEDESKPSEFGKVCEPPFARVRNYFRNRYGLNLDALPAHKKLPYLAGMIHFTNLRRALLNEYDI